MATDMLNAQTHKAQYEQLFYPGMQWSKPKKHVIIARIAETDTKKLDQWLANNEKIEIMPTAGEGFAPGEIWLLKEKRQKRDFQQILAIRTFTQKLSPVTQNSEGQPDTNKF
jgi:hypothetical protein